MARNISYQGLRDNEEYINIKTFDDSPYGKILYNLVNEEEVYVLTKDSYKQEILNTSDLSIKKSIFLENQAFLEDVDEKTGNILVERIQNSPSTVFLPTGKEVFSIGTQYRSLKSQGNILISHDYVINLNKYTK